MDHHPPYNNWNPPPPPPPPPPDFWAAGGGFQHHHDHFNAPPDHFNVPPDHFNGPPDHFNVPPDHFNGPPMFRKRKLDRPPDLNPAFAKLYVDPVPRNVSQDEVYHLFQEFGNIIEVVLLTDKITALQQEFCFVKYASVEEAQRAIAALHGQYAFPGAKAPLKVKFADREKKRLGWDYIGQHNPSSARSGVVQHDSNVSGPGSDDTVHKVYVNGLNKDASKEEIVEIFSPFGLVTDFHIMRDETRRSRGCGFVGFAQRSMAVAAINGLNKAYIMRGCEMPLTVRFADPKKPKNVDFRPPPHLADVQRNTVSSALHLGKPPACTKLISSGEQIAVNCIVPYQSRPPPEAQRVLTGKPFSPLQLSQMSLQVSQTSKSPKACTDVELKSARPSSEHGSCALSEIDYSEAFGDCDWSEHICPDGDKYYFNCVTSESSWEKPENFALCEQRVQRLKSQGRLRRGPHTSLTLVVASNEGDPKKVAQYQNNSRDFSKLQSPVSCAVEHTHELVPDEPSSVGGRAFVQ